MGRRWNGFKVPAEYCPVTGKVAFDKKGAQTAANARYHQDHVRLRIYPCQCGAWHLTKMGMRQRR